MKIDNMLHCDRLFGGPKSRFGVPCWGRFLGGHQERPRAEQVGLRHHFYWLLRGTKNGSIFEGSRGREGTSKSIHVRPGTALGRKNATGDRLELAK